MASEPDKVVAAKLIDALESTKRAPKTVAIVSSKFPSVVKQIQNGRWVVVWPRDFAAPGAQVVFSAP